MTFISSKLGLLLHRVIPGQMFVIICFTFEIYLKNVIIFLDEAYNLLTIITRIKMVRYVSQFYSSILEFLSLI